MYEFLRTMRMTVLEYLQDYNLRTGQTFESLVLILNKCGDVEGRKELNELLKAGVIAKRRGANGVIIEYLKPEP